MGKSISKNKYLIDLQLIQFIISKFLNKLNWINMFHLTTSFDGLNISYDEVMFM